MKLTLPAALLAALALAAPALAETEVEITDYVFPHEGPFGSYEPLQLQRGLKIYTEVCSSCHGLTYVAYRNLAEDGGPMLPEEQMRAYAAQFTVDDPSTDAGSRAATPADHFGPSLYEGAPDLSLMAKARAGFHGPYGTGLSQLFNGMGGPEYIASLLMGYEEAPACTPADFPGYYNVAFANGGFPDACKDEEGHHTVPGSWIAMPPPLTSDGQVTFDDGSNNSLEAMAVDAAAFLMWTAEPKLNARKDAGLTAVIFLVVLSALLYYTNKRIWAPVKAGGRPLGADQTGA